MANLMTSLGFPCGHEAIFTPEGLDKAKKILLGKERPVSSQISKGRNLADYEARIEADSSYMSAPLLSNFDAPVIHVVRNPIKVIGSYIKFGYFTKPKPTNSYENFIYKHVPELQEEMSQIDRVALFYTRWNSMIERHQNVKCRHKVEKGPEEIKKILGASNPNCYNNTKCNSGGGKQIDLGRISPQILDELMEIANRYGYLRKIFN